ncbi:maleylacetate reductase [Paraburkholderia phytofirmans]|uniref:Maleylacetate reductase n=1 Tax=Paraburkholderia phytofirmans TaxID=261302 RepID=A0ABW9BH69_9BURK
MQAFTYEALPARIVFGADTRHRIGDELARLDCRRALVLTTAAQRQIGENVRSSLGEQCVGLFSEAAMHTPTDITEAAVKVARDLGADSVVAVGGGSTIGLGKAIALHTDLPQIVVPTTYAGSEATPILGQTENGLKTTQRTLRVLPEVVIYDVDLTLMLPTGISVTSGLNAIAHAVEALYARDANPVISMLAEKGIAALVRALPAICAAPEDREARSDALFGAWACGTCLGAVGMSLHHKLCHTLGGTFNLPHAETHAVLLPHVIAYNRDYAPEALAIVARVLGVSDPAAGMFDFAKRLGAPTQLAALGMKESDIAEAVAIASRAAYWNPGPIDADRINRLLHDAFSGQRPISQPPVSQGGLSTTNEA